MKKFRKAVLYTYRILLFLILLCTLAIAGGKLLARILFFLLKPLILLYPPYSAWLVFALFFAAGIWSMVSNFRSEKEAKKKQAEPDNTQQPDFEGEIREIVERCLAKYSYNIVKGEDDYTISLPDSNRIIHIDIGQTGIETQIFAGGWDEESYYLDSPDDLAELEEEFSSNLDDWLNDRIVQVCFITNEDKFPYSFACSATDMDEVIFKNLESHSYDPWWVRILRVIFLFPSPKSVLEIQITSANGIHDRIIPMDT